MQSTSRNEIRERVKGGDPVHEVTAADIEREKRKIQSEWTDAERAKRAGQIRQPLEVPVVKRPNMG